MSRFGVEVMDVVASWTKNLCTNIVGGGNLANDSSNKSESKDEVCGDLSKWSVLDIGTGNGLLLQELAKQGYGIIFTHNWSINSLMSVRHIYLKLWFDRWTKLFAPTWSLVVEVIFQWLRACLPERNSFL